VRSKFESISRSQVVSKTHAEEEEEEEDTVDLASLVPGIDEMGNLTKQAFITPAMVVLVLLPRRNRSLATMDDDLELLGSGVDPIAEQFETWVLEYSGSTTAGVWYRAILLTGMKSI